jgi:hypothetical protein
MLEWLIRGGERYDLMAIVDVLPCHAAVTSHIPQSILESTNMKFCRLIASGRFGLCFILCVLAGPPVIAAEISDRIVVMISVDGLAGYYLDDPKAEMPTIRALAAGGARASPMKASTPTVTWPNHTTLVTGVNPARHGVLGNNYFDRKTANESG